MHTVIIAKTHNLSVDESKFTDEVKSFVFAYGLKQLLNDAGSAAKGVDEKLVFAEKKLAALYEGVLRTARGGSAKAALDPVQAEAERLAWDAIKVMLKAKGKKVADVTDEVREAAIAKHLEKNPDIRKTAEARIKALKNAKTVEVDLGELGL